MACLTPSIGDWKIETYPEAGSHPRCTAKMSTSTKPSQNDGIANPTTHQRLTNLSNRLPLRRQLHEKSGESEGDNNARPDQLQGHRDALCEEGAYRDTKLVYGCAQVQMNEIAQIIAVLAKKGFVEVVFCPDSCNLSGKAR